MTIMMIQICRRISSATEGRLIIVEAIRLRVKNAPR